MKPIALEFTSIGCSVCKGTIHSKPNKYTHMGKFKDVGNPAIALMEEMAEATQVIAKMYRFYGHWDEIPEGKDISRWEELCNEMEDVLYQWNRLVIEIHQDKTDNAPLTEESWGLLAKMNKH